MASITTTADLRPVSRKAAMIVPAAMVMIAVAVVAVTSVTTLSTLDATAVSVTLLTAAWHVGGRNWLPAKLNIASFGALGVVGVARLVQGQRWQMVPWELVAVVLAASAGLRLWRSGRSSRWTRTAGRTVLVAGTLVGLLALGFDAVPTLPTPSGPFEVGSQVFHWSDAARPESLTVDTQDVRQVVAQAWYPADSKVGHPTAYIEISPPVQLSATMPGSMFAEMDQVDTHATDQVPVDAERDTWPVLIFSPGLWAARQGYTALATDLASRGYVVVTMSHPYDSPATLLADGQALDASSEPLRSDVSMAEQLDIRAADAIFVLDQLTQLAELEPESPLVGRMDLDRVGMLGHSLGGATATQILAADDRFLAGLNIDGRLFGPAPALDQPFLWLQSGGPLLEGRDDLLSQLTGGGALVTVAGSEHMAFSDMPAYLTAAGRTVLGSLTGAGTTSADTMTLITADIVSTFFGPVLGGPGNGDLDAVANRHASVTVDQRLAPA